MRCVTDHDCAKTDYCDRLGSRLICTVSNACACTLPRSRHYVGWVVVALLVLLLSLLYIAAIRMRD